MKEKTMKHIATVALMLNLGVAGLYAQRPVNVKMTSSGTNVATAIDLQTGTVTDEVILAGEGTLGPFTYRGLHADSTSPQSSSTCSGPTHAYFLTVGGAGVFRFLDGSLLNVTITEGAGCVDLTVGVAQYTLSYKITGGTGRLKGVSGGTLTLTAMLSPVLFNASGAPELLTNTGEFEGTVSF